MEHANVVLPRTSKNLALEVRNTRTIACRDHPSVIASLLRQTMQLAIANARVQELVALSLREIIERFEQRADVPMHHHEALGVLEALGAFHDPDLAVVVGAWWARIVQKDVAYSLLEGLECIADSRPAADRLASSRDLRSDTLAAYVLVRWHDAAGRIQFRCGDMMAARLEFAAADSLAKDDELWFCRADVQSNLRRANFVERERVDDQDALCAERDMLSALHDETLRLARAHAIDVDGIESSLATGLDAFIGGSGTWQVDSDDRIAAFLPADDRERLRCREHLRGLANVRHNLSLVLKPAPQRHWPGDLETSRRLSRSVACIAYGLGDGYRLAQALRHNASIEPDDQRAIAVLETVRGRLPWERGRWLATQNLAKRLPRPAAVAMLDELFEELRQRQAARGGEIGFDVDVHQWAVDVLAEIAADDARIPGLRLEAARNVRRVVKVSTYRQRLAEVVYPAYLREIERVAGDGDPAPRSPDLAETADSEIERAEATLSVVEEASARELIDQLALAAQASGRQSEADPPARHPPGGTAPVVSSVGAARRELTRAGVLSDADEAIGQSRLAFEQRALYRPVASTPHDAEVAVALRRLTATRPGLVVVRYYLSGFDGARASKLSAMVFCDGHATPVRDGLDAECLRALASEPHTDGPRVERARRIWDVVIAPVAPYIWTSGVQPESLVVIPATGMFSLPLHIALPPGENAVPLGVQLPLCMSVSATAFVSRQRHLLQTQPVDPDDDLCALVPGDADVYPGELVEANWPSAKHFHLAGARPEELGSGRFTWWGAGNRVGLDHLLAQRAEFFVYAGHGVSVNRGENVEVALQLADGEYLTQYDLAMNVGFRRNKWTLIDACVSGVGGDTTSGEVAGFLRAFIAAGAGALAVTQWKVQDAAIARVAGRLLNRAANARSAGRCIDVVTALRDIHEDAFRAAVQHDGSPSRDITPPAERSRDPVADPQLVAGLHACPLVIYL